MDEILYLEADEEITSVIDKLKGLEARSIRLIAPKGSMIVQSVVSLKLIKKEAKSLGKEIALVTSDEVGRNLAGQVGLPVYADVKSSKPLSTLPQEPRVEKEPIEVDMDEAGEDLPDDFKIHRYDEGESEGEPREQKPPFVSRPVGDKSLDLSSRADLESARPIRHEAPVAKPSTKRRGRFKRTTKIILIATAVAALILAAQLTLSSLTVAARVAAREVNEEVEFTVEKDRPQSDLENLVVPGDQVSKEKDIEGEFEASGEKEVGDQAKGKVTFKNEAGVDEAISAGTTLRSSGGAEFALDADITVPKAQLNPAGDKVLGQAEGNVTAKESGTQGNLPSSATYVVSGSSRVTAQGGTSGGSSRKIKIVTKQDIERAKSALSSRQFELNELELKGGEIVIGEAALIELHDFTSSQAAGGEAEGFTAKGKLKYANISFREDDFKELVISSIEKNLPESQGLILMEDDLFTSSLKEADVSLGKLEVAGRLQSHVGPKLDLPSLKRSWRGKPISRIERELAAHPDIEVERLELSPSFALPVAPVLTRRIILQFEYTQDQ